MIQVRTNTEYTQAYGCCFCLHVGSVAVYFGRKSGGRGPRLEIMTPRRWWRWSGGYTDKRKVAEPV